MGEHDRVRVTAAQRRRLQAIVRGGDDGGKARLRATVILMSADGHGGEQIAATLGVTRRTVTNIRTRWRQHRLAGLADRPRSGRPALASAAYRAELRRVVEQDPRSFGYAFARWTAPRLAAHLARVLSIRLSGSQVLRLLRRDDFVWRRTKRTLRNLQDPAEVAQAQTMLEGLKRRVFRGAVGTNSGSPTA